MKLLSARRKKNRRAGKKYIKNIKGNVQVLLIFFIVMFAIMVTGLFNNFTEIKNNPNNIYIIVTPTPLSSKKTLQMQSLEYTIITREPTSPQTQNSSSPTVCTDKPSNSHDLNSTISDIKTKYGVIVSGDHSLTLDKANMVFNTLCKLFTSQTYIKNLNSVKTSITPNPSPVYLTFSYQNTCFAWTYNGSHSELREPCTDIVDSYIIIHEFTHIMQLGAALGRNAHSQEWQSQVWSSESSHPIPTGPCVLELHRPDSGECEADAVAEFVYYKEYRNSWSGAPPAGKWSFNPPTYPTEWIKWYTFAQTKIFGFAPGHDFYNP